MKEEKHYCCLHHFSEGKKGKGSSPCYNHVPLGVINPVPSTVPRSPRSVPSGLKVAARQNEINFHTHDLNEIQHKQTLPKRLAYPRVYVEQINPRLSQENCNIIAGSECFLKGKEFQDIFLLFKKYAKLTSLKTQEEALRHVHRYGKAQGFDLSKIGEDASLPQYFFKHNDFSNYLISVGFSEQDAEQFWKVAFNQKRFSPKGKDQNEVVSMRAFSYNYKKFYLDEMETYKNCLSQPALRQRMIDLRLFLEPWFTSNIIFKENHKNWKEVQLEICSLLKTYGEDRLYSSMLSAIQLRNRIWLFMRTLAKIFFQVTDQKNIGLQIFNQRATDLILKNKQSLEAFSEFLNEFQTTLLQSNRTKDEKFKITHLLQYCKEKVPHSASRIASSLRGIFKYLYFFKQRPELSLNHHTLNLDCSCIAEVNYNELLEFLSFKQKETTHLMEMIEALCREVNETVDARPEVNGYKRFLNECNYLAECLLKMVKRCDFTVFYRLKKARELHESGETGDLKRLEDAMKEKQTGNEEITTHFWKATFSFENHEQRVEESVSSQSQINEKNYQLALDSYEELRKRLEGKLPNSQQENQELSVKGSKASKVKTSKPKKGEKGNSINPAPTETKQISSSSSHNCYGSYCSLCDDVCSTSVNSSLLKIDDMSNYLLDLLRDI